MYKTDALVETRPATEAALTTGGGTVALPPPSCTPFRSPPAGLALPETVLKGASSLEDSKYTEQTRRRAVSVIQRNAEKPLDLFGMKWMASPPVQSVYLTLSVESSEETGQLDCLPNTLANPGRMSAFGTARPALSSFQS